MKRDPHSSSVEELLWREEDVWWWWMRSEEELEGGIICFLFFGSCEFWVLSFGFFRGILWSLRGVLDGRGLIIKWSTCCYGSIYLLRTEWVITVLDREATLSSHSPYARKQHEWTCAARSLSPFLVRMIIQKTAMVVGAVLNGQSCTVSLNQYEYEAIHRIPHRVVMDVVHGTIDPIPWH